MYVSMKGMLKRANEGNYAVMAINCFNIETARAVINAAQSLRAPIIINIVQEHMVNHCDSNLIAPIVKKLAQRASVEVALNFDHGEEIGLLKKALVDGYSSVMVDASRYNLEGNIRMTREIVEFAKKYDILIIDEPTSQLDPEGTESVFAIIKAMKDKQKTIILVEHKIDLIAEYADDVLVLKDGELIAVGDKNEILTDITLMEKGVALPQVVLLAVKLQKAGLPLTKIPVTEKQAIEMIGQAMKEKRG